MKIYSLSDLPLPFSSVVAIGAFDGLHRGHLVLLREAQVMAKDLSASPLMLTFCPHPREVLQPQLGFKYLTLLEEKIEILSSLQYPGIVLLPFTSSLAELTPNIFVERYLVDLLKVKGVVVGYNFRFGRQRLGNAETLIRLGEKYNFMVKIVEPVIVDGVKVSSSLIRDLLVNGEIEKANWLLGRYYTIKGKVISGKGRGNLLGFPTANLEVSKKKLLPKEGVYVVWVYLEGKRYQGVFNIGKNPTFDEKELSLEVHILNFSENIYGKNLKIELVKYIRGEKKFPSVQALVEQIKKDCLIAKEILERENKINH